MPRSGSGNKILKIFSTFFLGYQNGGPRFPPATTTWLPESHLSTHDPVLVMYTSHVPHTLPTVFVPPVLQAPNDIISACISCSPPCLVERHKETAELEQGRHWGPLPGTCARSSSRGWTRPLRRPPENIHYQHHLFSVICFLFVLNTRTRNFFSYPTTASRITRMRS